jgi:hypothetical protein
MKLLLSGLLAAVLMGCCTERDSTSGVSIASYKEAVTQIRGNIATIRSDVAEITYHPVTKEAHLQLLDATISLCDDTLAGKVVGVAVVGSDQ